MLQALLLTAAMIAAPPPPPAVGPVPVSWRIDVGHSELSFRIRHFMSKVPGTFKTWSGTILADPEDLAGGSVEVTIETASIDTKHDRRDADLRSDNFFLADSFPVITFKSTKVEVSGTKLTITGDLTIRGVTRPVTLEGEYLGILGKPEPRMQRMGFSASSRINRLDYGVKWNRAVEGGGVLLGDEVDITINVEAVRQ